MTNLKEKKDDKNYSDSNISSITGIKCRDDGINNILSITDQDGTVYEFEKPEFECELLVVKNNKIIGIAYDDINVIPCMWDINGTSLTKGFSVKDITPIKPKEEVMSLYWKDK